MALRLKQNVKELDHEISPSGILKSGSSYTKGEVGSLLCPRPGFRLALPVAVAVIETRKWMIYYCQVQNNQPTHSLGYWTMDTHI